MIDVGHAILGRICVARPIAAHGAVLGGNPPWHLRASP
jgi:hypothetical protein